MVHCLIDHLLRWKSNWANEQHALQGQPEDGKPTVGLSERATMVATSVSWLKASVANCPTTEL